MDSTAITFSTRRTSITLGEKYHRLKSESQREERDGDVLLVGKGEMRRQLKVSLVNDGVAWKIIRVQGAF